MHAVIVVSKRSGQMNHAISIETMLLDAYLHRGALRSRSPLAFELGLDYTIPYYHGE